MRILLADGLTVTEIAARLGVSKPTVCFHKRSLGIAADSKFSRRYDWKEIRAHYDAGHSMRECQLKFGFSGVKRNRYHLKRRLLRDGLKDPWCEECGIAEWRGRSLSLELHHINGDGRDNRRENLQLLCPNCHSLADNWGGYPGLCDQPERAVPSRGVRGAFCLLIVAAFVAGCGGDDTTTTGVPAEATPTVPKPSKQVVVHESEFKLDPAQADGGDQGLVSIKIVNDGEVAHALAVDVPNGLVELDGRVEPGATATLEADLDKPGTYTMYCPLDGHRAKGMSGSITVAGDNPARGAEPGGTTTTSTSTTPTQTQTTTQTRTQTQTETTTVTTPTETETQTTPTATTGSESPY